jgi:hypothetical protein
MGLRGRQAMPTEYKISAGTLNKSREVKRLALEMHREWLREQEQENRRFVIGITNFFMDEPVEEAWLEEALRTDVNALASRMWKAYASDFREEYAKRYPGKAMPSWWSKYESHA